MADAWAALRRTARDRISGAAQIAARAAEAFRGLEPERADEGVRLLLAGHPEMAPLWRLATDVLDGETPAAGAERFLSRLEEDGGAPRVLAPRLPPWLLTISYSSTVLATVSAARVRLLSCMRSLPGGEGERMAHDAADLNRQTKVVEDDEALRLVPAAAVIVGADAVTPEGLVNKVKTRALAEAANARDVPVFAVAGGTKFLARDLPVESPFERIPLELFTAIASPAGLLTPDEALAEARLAVPHPTLDDLV